MNTPRSTVTVLPVHRAGLASSPAAWTAHWQQCRGFDVPAISQALKVASEFQDAYGTERKTLALLRARLGQRDRHLGHRFRLSYFPLAPWQYGGMLPIGASPRTCLVLKVVRHLAAVSPRAFS
jgi:hypothetical protein